MTLKSLFLPTPTFTMLEFIAKKSGKTNIIKFLDALALQEYEEYSKKKFHKGVLK